MYNSATLIGNVGADPDIRAMQNGKKVANIRLATSERWKDRDGEPQERTEWHSIVAFDKLAEIVERYVKKGDRLHISGRIQTRKWQDRDGNDRYTTEIVVDQRGVMNMLGGHEGAKGGQSRGQKESYQRDDMDDEIPF